MHAGRTRAALCLAILLCCGSRAAALNPALVLSQYAHTSWTIREGFFNSPVWSIAQTPDGYLWLGTDAGLVRFDGVRAVPWQPRDNEQLPSTNVTKLLVTRDGSLWIGTSAGLASWKGGRLVTYPEVAGQQIVSLIEDAQQTVWVGTTAIPTARLCAIRGTVQCFGQDGRLGLGVFSLLDDGGTLWVGAASGVWRWTRDAPAHYAMPTPNVNDLIKMPDGRLLIGMPGGIRQLVSDELELFPMPRADRPFSAFRLLADRDRGLWIATQSEGLVHFYNGRVDRFTRTDGLSSNVVHALFEDREGNVWVATNEGLDQFRELAVTALSRGQGLASDSVSCVLNARDGSVWVGTADGLTRWKDERATIYRTREGLPDNRVVSLFEDRAGRILAATLRGIVVFHDGRFVPWRSGPTRVVYGIVEEQSGAFWISDQEQGLIQLIGERVVRRIPWPALGHDDHATAIVADPTRRGIWLGFYKGGIAFLKDGAIHALYGAADGLGAGRVSALQLDEDGVLWAATAAGLSRIADSRVTTLSPSNGLPCATVHWMISDVDRSVWLSMPCGLVRINSAELMAWIAEPNRAVTSTLFDSSDGVRGEATPIGLNPPAARQPDGRLWFASPNGVGIVDPRHLPVNTVPPAVQIERIVADRRAYDTMIEGAGGVSLPPRVRDLQIDYTALSFVAPDKVRFRYKLEGFDRDWRDVGLRRQAFYTDLPPRQYRFRVAAANSDGIWNEAGATLDFSVAPAYYQTTWFLALSAGMVLALLWTGHHVRLRIVEKHQQEISALNERLMKAQEQERIRIAGELHDGVMQEMLAVTMMLGTAKRRVSSDADAKATMGKIQEKMIRVGTDIRRLSHDLHPPALQEAGLPGAIQAYCDEFSASSGIPLTCEVDEQCRELSRGAALALFRVVQEALGNAAKHGAPKRIAVRLTRANGLVSLTVSDNGIGFDRGRVGGGGLGLITMRERASQLNGTFECESAAGRGTTVRVVIPFR